MKNKKKILLAAAISAVVLFAAVTIIIVCSVKDDPALPNETQGELEGGTLDENEHLSPPPITFPDNTTDETEANIPTEPESEPESEPAPESETETMPESEPDVILQYYSYGNGTCAVIGIEKLNGVYVTIPEKSPSGDIVIAVESKAFYNNKTVKAISISSTVMSIEPHAFAGCSSLVYISVSENNKAFCDLGGILYSKDKSHLILFPSSNPATEITIPVTVTEIADMAFASSPALKLINYDGALRDWSEIKIGDDNYGLFSAAMTFAGTK